MNEVYGICINRNLILSRSPSSSLFPFFFPLHSPRCLTSSRRVLLLILLLLSLSPFPAHPAFSNFLGSSLLPSDEIYKAVERRVPLKSRQSVDFCRGTELETLLSLSLSLPLHLFLFLSIARWLVLSLTVAFFFFFFFVVSRIPSASALSSLCIQPFRASSPARECVYLVNARM